jgi:hypothetical protein
MLRTQDAELRRNLAGSMEQGGDTKKLPSMEGLGVGFDGAGRRTQDARKNHQNKHQTWYIRHETVNTEPGTIHLNILTGHGRLFL